MFINPLRVMIAVAMSLAKRTEYLDQLFGITFAIQVQNLVLPYVSYYLILQAVYTLYCFCTLQFRQTFE